MPTAAFGLTWSAPLFDQGHTLAAARILDLEDDLAAERALTARLHERLGDRDGPDG